MKAQAIVVAVFARLAVFLLVTVAVLWLASIASATYPALVQVQVAPYAPQAQVIGYDVYGRAVLSPAYSYREVVNFAPSYYRDFSPYYAPQRDFFYGPSATFRFRTGRTVVVFP